MEYASTVGKNSSLYSLWLMLFTKKWDRLPTFVRFSIMRLTRQVQPCRAFALHLLRPERPILSARARGPGKR
jgi:hypothetical protein